TLRSESGHALHKAVPRDAWAREYGDRPFPPMVKQPPYRMGLEAIRDALLLARCDVFLGSQSSLSYFVAAYNPQIPWMHVDSSIGAIWSGAFPELRAKEDVIQHLRQVVEERGQLIESLHQTAEERGELIASLHQVAEERGQLIESLHQAAEEQRVRTQSLQHVAEERGQLIESLHQATEEQRKRRPRWLERAISITRECGHRCHQLVVARVERAVRLVRFGDWWHSKIPPLLAVAYVQMLRLELGLGTASVLLGCYLCSIACVAAYGHVINDVFDVQV